MRGGVTSGIVYPKAVFEIADRYRFRSVGGTSAGAIAATVTAAAEFGRLSGRNPSGVRARRPNPSFLGTETKDGSTLLGSLFAADGSTRELYKLFQSAISEKALTAAFNRVGRNSLIIGGVSILLAISCFLALLARDHHIGMLVSTLCVGAIAGLVAAGAYIAPQAKRVLGLLKEVPALVKANRFGLCSGMAVSGQKLRDGSPTPSLTAWIYRQIQETAGLDVNDPPLTFGDLWIASKRRPGAERPDKIDPTAERDIELVLMSTNLTRGVSTRVPFMDSFGITSASFCRWPASPPSSRSAKALSTSGPPAA